MLKERKRMRTIVCPAKVNVQQAGKYTAVDSACIARIDARGTSTLAALSME